MTTPTIPTPAVSGRSGSTERPANAAPPRPAANARTAASSAVQTAVQTMFQKAIATSSTSDVVWVPAVSALLVLAVGALSLATKRPWLFAALGPTAVMLAANPGHPTTRFHAIVVGHLVALSGAWIAVLLMGASDSSSLLAGSGVAVVRVWASAFAIAIMAAVQPSLRAYHPPAA